MVPTRSAVLFCFLSSCAASAAEKPAQRPVPLGELKSASAPSVWLRTYPIREFGQFWHLDLQVKDGAAARKKILALMEKSGATSVNPIENAAATSGLEHQQFSFRIGLKQAQRAADGLKGLGKATRFTKRDNAMPEFTDEVAVRIRNLTEERAAGRAMLAQLPSVSSAIDEILAHLELAYISYRDSADRVLFNLSVEQASK